jgi:hypothetical protein
MSALLPKSDMCGATRNVSYGPQANIAKKRETASELAASLWRQDPISGGDVTKLLMNRRPIYRITGRGGYTFVATAVWEG